MDCKALENLWIDYFDDALEATAQREVEEHLTRCEKCDTLVAELRANIFLANAIPEVEPPPRLTARIFEATSGAQSAPAWYDFIFDFIRPQTLPKFAMGSLMAVASLAIVLYSFGVDFSHVTSADLAPSRLWERTNREVHLAYSRSVKYYNALRIVYEIQSRLETVNPSSGGTDSATPSDQSPPQNAPSGPSKPGSQRTFSFEERFGAIEVVENRIPMPNSGGLS
jgi:hypothetical protein